MRRNEVQNKHYGGPPAPGPCSRVVWEVELASRSIGFFGWFFVFEKSLNLLEKTFLPKDLDPPMEGFEPV